MAKNVLTLVVGIEISSVLSLKKIKKNTQTEEAMKSAQVKGQHASISKTKDTILVNILETLTLSH